MPRSRRRHWLNLALGTALGAAPAALIAQEPDRGRAAAEAANQATEADRLFKLGEFAAALPLYEAERTSRAATGDLRYEAYALRAIGICHAELGDDEGGVAAWKLAYDLDLKRDDPGYAGYDDFLIAQAEARLGRPEDAIRTLGRALPRLTGAADRDHEVDALLVLTRLLVGAGRPDEARPHVARALDLAAQMKDDGRLADAQASSGQVEGTSGHPAAALDLFAKAQQNYEQQGRAAEVAWMETVGASTLLLLDRPAEALAKYEKAAELHKHLKDGGATSEDLAAAAGLHLGAGRLDPALAAATEAVAQARDADDRFREIEACVRLAQVEGARGDWPHAAATLDEAVTLGRQVNRDDPAEQVRLLLAAAATDGRAGLTDRVGERLKAAEQLADESRSPALKQTVTTATEGLRVLNPPIRAEPVPPPPIPPRS